MKHLIEFERMEWVTPAAGVRYKAYICGNQRVRLLEFSEGVIEPDWCMNGHAGYVLEGECQIDFNGSMESFTVGDAFFIPEGTEDKHMITMSKGGWVQMILFELVK